MYYIIAYRESGPVSECPIPFRDLEAAKFCADITAFHFGPGWTIAVEEYEDGTESQLRPTDYDTA